MDTEAKGQGQAGDRALKSLSASYRTTVLITPSQGTIKSVGTAHTPPQGGEAT